MKRIWPFAFLVAVAMVALAALLPPSVEVPPGYDPALIKPGMDWRDVVSYPPTEPGNAAEPYIEIVRQYLPPGRGVRWPEGKVLPPLLKLAKQGARRKECNLGTEVFATAEEGQHRLLPVTDHDDLLGHLAPLRGVGRALRTEGDALYADGQVEEAVRAYEAAVILGARLVEGCESSIQVLVGLVIQEGYDRKKKYLKDAVTSLYLSEGDDTKYQQWIRYYAALDEFREKFGDKIRRIEAVNEAGLSDRAFDDKTAKPEDIEFALAVALQDEDALMKREAILALGTLKQPSRRVKAVLSHVEKNDTDRYVREAARNTLKRLGPRVNATG